MTNLNNFMHNKMFNFKKILTFALLAWGLLEEPLGTRRSPIITIRNTGEERERGKRGKGGKESEGEERKGKWAELGARSCRPFT